MKKIVIFFLIIASVYGQSNPDLFTQANIAYRDSNYSLAKQLFDEVKANNLLDEQTISTAKYFAAKCLLNLDQLDGAVIEFESFLKSSFASNYRPSALYKLGILYNTKREYRKARDRFTTLITDYPFSEYHGSSQYWIGESYAAENKFIEAEENFKDAIASKRTNQFYVNSIYSLAQVYEKTGDYENAIKQYDELLTYYKQSSLASKAQLRIGICYFNLQDYDNAILELGDTQINSLDEENKNEAKFYLANAHARLNEFTDSAALLDSLSTASNDTLFVQKVKFSRAWIDFQQGKYSIAYNTYKELYDTANDSVKTLSLFWLGECKRYLGEAAEADKIFQEFIQKYPEHRLAAKAQLGRGAVYVVQNNSSGAESSLQNAILSSDKTTKIKALTLLGEIRLNNNSFIEAKKYFADAYKLQPNQVEVKSRLLLGLGAANYFLKNYDEAEKNLDELNKSDKSFESDKVNFYLAETYYAKGKYSAALKYYNLIKSSDKSINRQTLIGKAYSYFNSKDFANAIIFFNDYASKYPSDKNINEIKLRLADSYFGSKNFDKAANVYKQIFLEDKSNIQNDVAFYQYSQSLFKAGKSNEAKNAFEELQSKFPKSKFVDESQYVIGWIDFQQNKFDDAIISYKELMRKYSNSELRPIAEYSIGDAYFNKADYDSAIYYYTRVIDEYPNTQFIFDAVNGIQYSYVAKEQPQNAISFIDDFIVSHPTSKYGDQIYFKKGDLFYSIEEYSNAIKAYKDFIEKYPSSPLIPNAFFWIGKSTSNLNNTNEAISNFLSARSRSPKTDIGISSTVELTTLYISKKQFDDAIKLLDETIAANSSSNRISELLYLKGDCEVKAGRNDDAVVTFEQIVNYYENSIFAAKAKTSLGIVEIDRKNFERALNLLREVAENRTDDIGAQAQYFMGVSYYSQDKINDAMAAFARTRSVFAAYDEWYTKSLLKLGDCFIKLNDKKQAREMFRAVLMRHNNDTFADEAKKKMRGL